MLSLKFAAYDLRMNKHILSILFITLFTTSTFAYFVHKVEGEHALVDLQGKSAIEGDLLVAKSPAGENVGVLRVQKIIGERALGRVVRGKVQEGWSLDKHVRGGSPIEEPKYISPPAVAERKDAYEPEKEPEPLAEPEEKPAPVARGESKTKLAKKKSNDDPDQWHFGAMIGYSMDNQTVVLGTSKTATPMSNTSINGYGFLDYKFNSYFDMRPFLGIEQFYVTGTNSAGDCTQNTQCSTTVQYATAGSWVRVKYPGDFSPWFGIGGDYLHPMGKVSNALNTDSINPVIVGLIGVGIDWKITKQFIIPVLVEYGYWPEFTGVTSNWVSIRAGVAL